MRALLFIFIFSSLQAAANLPSDSSDLSAEEQSWGRESASNAHQVKPPVAAKKTVDEIMGESQSIPSQKQNNETADLRATK
jgi:hypothetical protein